MDNYGVQSRFPAANLAVEVDESNVELADDLDDIVPVETLGHTEGLYDSNFLMSLTPETDRRLFWQRKLLGL